MMTFIAATIERCRKAEHRAGEVVHGQIGGKQEQRHGDAAGGRADQYRESATDSIDEDAHAERCDRADHELRGRQQVDFRVRPAELLHRRAVHERQRVGGYAEGEEDEDEGDDENRPVANQLV